MTTGHSPCIAPLAAESLALIDGDRYDAAIASLGFETRCRQIPEALGNVPRTAVIPFGDRRELAYTKNSNWFGDHSWERVEIAEEEIAEWAGGWLGALCAGRSEPARVAVDVSSMNRPRIAAIIEAILSLPEQSRIEVDLLYTPAKFRRSDHSQDPPIFNVAPVSDYFAGWWTDLDAPLAAVIGVGCELEMAASAIDKLEPERTIVFRPEGDDPRYAREVDRANRALMQTRGVRPDPVQYRVADPFGCFSELETMLAMLERRFRLALVPLGPKIYAACAMLAAALHSETSQVIRVSAGTRQVAQDRTSAGNVYGLRVLLSPPRTETQS